MGLRLGVRQAWHDRVRAVAEQTQGIIPVVKGNGYGFGRRTLMPLAGELSDSIAVGTVHEAADVPSARVALVLTPHLSTLPDDLPSGAILTVGSVAHVDALRANGWRAPLTIKLRSSMHRYGASPEQLTELVDAVGAAKCTVAGYALHLPLAGSTDDRVGEIRGWIDRLDRLDHLDPTLPISVSHLDDDGYTTLRDEHPERAFGMRMGTRLWHCDKSLLQLDADVLDVHRVAEGSTAGYHATIVPTGGYLVLIAAGSTHGVQPLDDGRSPFHFERQRLALLEPPHMHTSMAFVPDGQPCPRVGDRVDVQRPLTMTNVDELVWLDG